MEKARETPQNKTLHQSRIYEWAMQKAGSSRATFWISLLFFLEIVLFVPLDAILLFFCLQNRSKIFIYAIIGAIASTFSALLGYFAGHFLWDLLEKIIIPHLISQNQFNTIANHFILYENLAVFIGMLLPFPVKALSLTAGAFHLELTSFILYALLARILRFFFVGTIAFIWGEKVEIFFKRHFNTILIAVFAKVLVLSSLFWFFSS